MALLDNYLKDKRITQSMIAKTMDKPSSSVAAVINSKIDITEQNNIQTIRAIAKIINKTPGDILNELINLEDIIMGFNENCKTYLVTNIFNKDDSIFSDEVVEYDDFSEALSDLESNVKTNKINDRITYGLTISDENDVESIILNIELENNTENTGNSYVDNLELLPEVLRNDVKKFASAHSIKAD